ncbi:MAG: hypothetical protein JXB45_09710 [Candidatus Krumholzibacteriota bacterium]|nr:hypothetical protein [Candidatus Krumholzibacteriota bacterium]
MSAMKLWKELILYLLVIIIIFMALFPPWYIEGEGKFKRLLPPRRYHFIFSPPSGFYRIDFREYIWPLGTACLLLLLVWLEFIPDRESDDGG